MKALCSLLGLLGVLALAGVSDAWPPATTASDRDCSDFENQAQAQRYFVDTSAAGRGAIPDAWSRWGRGRVRLAALPL
jgi:hypothetical protein